MYQICDGAYLFRKVISLKDQEALIDYYLHDKDNFYTPVLKRGNKMSITTNCYGWHWNAKNYKYSRTRDDVDQKQVPCYPLGFDRIFKPLVQSCFSNYDLEWNVCISNHYNIGISRLGMHQDNSESIETMSAGHPIVSLSIGASCIFEMGHNKAPSHKVRLNGGDVLIFGGPARMMYHGVAKVLDDDYHNREILGKKIGRLNFTFRKM